MTYDDYIWDGPSFRQRDLIQRVVYDRDYIDVRYQAIDANVRSLAEKRLRILEAFVLPIDSPKVFDVGCGSNRFIQASAKTGWAGFGYDVVPGDGRRCHLPEATAQVWDVVTFFDSLEHFPDPVGLIQQLRTQWIMVSVPECHHPSNSAWFMSWKHRRPGEHLWHWNRTMLGGFFLQLGYREVMTSSFEDAWRPNHEQDESNILTAIYRRIQ